MKKKCIFVTGGMGFIGSNLIGMLIDQKYNVINIDKVSYSSNFYNTINFRKNRYYKFYKCNIGNKNKIKYLFKKYYPICIFNLAAETHVDRSIDSPENFINSNIVDFYNFLENFKLHSNNNKKTKLIHISTDEVYGDIIKGRSDEKHKYNPSSPYAASKAASDLLLSSYIRTFKVPAIITNCSNNYGPKQHPEKLIPKLIYNILHNRSLPIYGNGKNSREWIYVEDHCKALIKVFQKGKIGEFYNIGSNKNLNNLEICKYLIKIAKTKINIGKNVKIKFVKDRPGHDKRYALNSKKILNKIGWKSTTKFKYGLEKTFSWYLNNDNYYKSINKLDITKRIGNL
jgi:dTDP-glucose 4,6-dehydratase